MNLDFFFLSHLRITESGHEVFRVATVREK